MHSSQIPLVAAMLASAATAHVVLENPRPFKFVADGPTNPVSSDGSDFPYKIPPGQTYEIDGERTVYAAGEPQRATFKGQAVHGGGRCQFALSADEKPTKDSTWMVIHSVEGGCPARNQKGNLEGENEDEYSFTVPEAIAPGDYVFAWTWQARVGAQPEYYMNCAPITVPIAYPHPGKSVGRPEGEANLFKQPCDGNPRVGENPAPAPAPGEPAAPSSIETAAPTPTPAPSAAPAPPSEEPSGQCTEGRLTCLPDEVHFATCTGGKLTPPQPIAPGFKCRAGEGGGLDISPA